MFKNYPASLISLREMLFGIRKEALKCGFKVNSLYKIELAAEEALVNIIKHGLILMPHLSIYLRDPTEILIVS